MKHNSLSRYKTASIIIPIIVLILFIIRNDILAWILLLPPCPFRSIFHIYCPACGNTRCVKALLHGDILSALRYNITPVIFGIFFLLAYIELVSFSFGRHLRILPRKLSFYLILIILLVLYLIIRNFIPYLTP